MARRLRYPSLENHTARLKLVVRRKPYPGPTLARGVLLLYRRNKGNGSCVLKASDGRGKYWTKAIGEADDFDASNADTTRPRTPRNNWREAARGLVQQHLSRSTMR